MSKVLTSFQSESEELLRQITKYLDNDPRVMAAWLFGSLGRGDADELSDIDIFVVVTDECLQDVVTQRQQFVTQIGNIVFFVEAPQNAPQDGGYLMAYY
ncbi:MAG: nucleotidyltransferase domain-containing protein, partial [Candidatus Promineifilaceae bacterium]